MTQSAKTPAKKKETPPAVYDYSGYEGAGLEELNSADFAIPFLYVLQSLSPDVVDGKEGAASGVIKQTVSEELYPADEAKDAAGVVFVPVFREHVFCEWKPRDEGGGLIGHHAIDSDVVRHAKENYAFGHLKTEAGNDLIETFYVYGMHIKPDGESEPAVIAFNSTKIKVWKQWATRLSSLRITLPNGSKINPPMWAHTWRITTVQQQKANNKWHNLRIQFTGANAEQSRIDPQSELFSNAVDLHEVVKSGGARLATETLTREAGDEGESETPF